MKDRNQNIPETYLILIKEKKILLLKRLNTGYEDGNYGLVSGHVEKGESFKGAIVREALEEANIILNEKDLTPVHIMHRKSNDSERIGAFFLVDKWIGKIENKEPHKCSDLSFFDLDKLPENTIDYIKHAIENFQENIFYSERGWE